MSIRNALLSLIAQHPTGAAALRASFEDLTQHAWPINIGQVYQTIQRLDRDGLIEAAGRDGNVELYQVTAAGREELEQWWGEAVSKPTNTRDELVIKVVMAAINGINTDDVIHQQRQANMAALREVVRTSPNGLADQLLKERRIFDLEAEARWLDRIETLKDQ